MYKNENSRAIAFAAWELRLYLDTHPDDAKALAAYKQLCAALGGAGYACGALSDGNSCSLGLAIDACNDGCPICANDSGESHWSWIDGPWPWQLEANLNECEG